MNYMHVNEHQARRHRLWGEQATTVVDAPPRPPRQRDFIYVQMDPFEEPVTVSKSVWRDIANQVCSKHRVSVMDIRGERRTKHIVIARHELAYRLVTETGISLVDIGRKLGNRDPSTIGHAVRSHAKRMVEAAAR